MIVSIRGVFSGMPDKYVWSIHIGVCAPDMKHLYN